MLSSARKLQLTQDWNTNTETKNAFTVTDIAIAIEPNIVTLQLSQASPVRYIPKRCNTC